MQNSSDPSLWLAIETSGRAGSVALARGPRAEQRLAEADLPAQRRHNVELFPVIARLFENHRLHPGNLTHIAVSAGPGSFTALRIGIVAARTLAQASGASLVAIPTFEALAQTVAGHLLGPARNILTIVNAKRGHVFGQVFGFQAWPANVDEEPVDRTDGSLSSSDQPGNMTLVPLGEYELRELLARSPRPLLAVGEACREHAMELKTAAVEVPEPLIERPTASAVLEVAARKVHTLQDAAFCELHSLEPIYVRLAEAEEKWQVAQKIDLENREKQV